MTNNFSQSSEFKNKQYDIEDFNSEMRLKFGFNNLVLVFVLFSPLFVGGFASMIAKHKGANYLSAIFGNIDHMIVGFIMTLPAVVFVVSNVLASKNAGGVIQFVLKNGRGMLIFSALLHFLYWGWLVFLAGAKINTFQLTILVISAYLFLYALRSKRLYDYFISQNNIANN
jgi:Protein of unknown function (DUF2919)